MDNMRSGKPVGFAVLILLKAGNVASLRQRNQNRIPRTLGVMLPQFVTKAAGVHADDRVRSVEGLTPTVEIGSQHLLFQQTALTVQRLLDDITEKRAEPRGASKGIAGE